MRPTVESRSRMAFGLLLAFIVGWYWMPSTTVQASAPHNLLFYLLVMPGLWMLSIGKPIGRQSNSALVLASAGLMTYLAASCLWVQGSAERSSETVFLHAIATATFTAAVYQLFDRSRFRQFQIVIVSAATSITVVSIIAFFLGRIYPVDRLHSAIHFEHPNLFAQVLGFAALLALRAALRAQPPITKIVLAISLSALGYGILLTRSRAVILAVVAAALITIAMHRGRKAAIITLVVISIIAGIFAIAGPTVVGFVARGDAGRIQIWQTLLERAADNPLVGAGINANDNVVFPKDSWEFPGGFTTLHTHSAIVGSLYYGGLIGLAWLLLVILLGLKAGWRNGRSDGEWMPLILLCYGLMCLAPDGHRLISEPHLSSWLLFWFPLGLIAAGPFDRLDFGNGRSRTLNGATGETKERKSLPSLTGAITVILILAALLLRAPHLGEKIDGPHTWRQCDTAQYIHAFYTDGIDLMHPSVCWMGDHRTLILEFPLPEAVAAVAYHLFGPSHVTARWVTLIFFIGSTLFFFLFVRSITDQGTAKLATVISMIVPLALFYSRAVHIDYSALFFAYAMAWLWTEAIKKDSALYLWLGSVPAMLALMIKAPYVLPFVPLLIWLTIFRKRWILILKHSPALILPGLIFAAWQWHTTTVNGAAPDWSFIPSYRLFTNNGHWYFGPLSMRLDPFHWGRIFHRVLYEISGWVGLVLALIGIAFSISERRSAFFLWIGGAGLGVLVFFNLNVVHNYYQIALVGPISVAIALGARHVTSFLPARSAFKQGVLLVLVLVVGVESVNWAEDHYYVVLEPLRTAGLAIGAVVPEGDLVIVSAGGLDPRSPHLLYRARRYGWSIPDRALNANLVHRLEGIGAQWLAIVGARAPSGILKAYLAKVPLKEIKLPGGRANLFLYHLADRQPEVFDDGFEEGSISRWPEGP